MLFYGGGGDESRAEPPNLAAIRQLSWHARLGCQRHAALCCVRTGRNLTSWMLMHAPHRTHYRYLVIVWIRTAALSGRQAADKKGVMARLAAAAVALLLLAGSAYGASVVVPLSERAWLRVALSGRVSGCRLGVFVAPAPSSGRGCAAPGQPACVQTA